MGLKNEWLYVTFMERVSSVSVFFRTEAMLLVDVMNYILSFERNNKAGERISVYSCYSIHVYE